MNTVQSGFAAALLNPDAPCPPGLRAWNGSDVSVRFAVYRNNVVASLIGVLADTFPVVQELVGVEFFRAMAAVFVRASPPRSPLMAEFGTGFAEFIDGFEPARTVHYLADVARLEMARLEALHAADMPPFAPAAVMQALAAGERIGDLRLVTHSCVRLVQSAFPLFTIWAAHQGQGELGAVDLAQPESVLVLRQDGDVLSIALPHDAACFLADAMRGLALGECVARAQAAQPAFDLAATLALLVHHGVFASIELPSKDLP